MLLSLSPGESIRPADPIVFDRIRIAFHRNPTLNRSDPAEFLSDSFQSDSDADFVGIQRNPMKSGSDLVGFQSCSVKFRQNPGWNPTERNPTKTLSDPIEIISIRRDPIPPQSHGISVSVVTKCVKVKLGRTHIITKISNIVLLRCPNIP